MYCSRCGKLNQADALFCYSCGQRITTGESTPEPVAMPKEQTEAVSPTMPTPQARAALQEQPPAPSQTQLHPPTYPNGQPPTYPNGQSNGQPPNYPNGQSNSFPKPLNGNYSQVPGQIPPFQSPQSSPPPFNAPFPPGQMPTAPNGKPYPVAAHPEAFYSYKNKENKQVYAPLAPTSMRFIAAIIDTFILSLVNMLVIIIYLLSQNQLGLFFAAIQNNDTSVLQNTPTPDWLNLLNNTLYLVYCTLMIWLSNGQTIGKKILGIKIMRMDGTKPDFKTALLRSAFGFSFVLGMVIAPYGTLMGLLSLFLWVIVMLGFTNVFRDKLRQGWHDKLAETIVVGTKELVQGVNY